MVYKRWEIVSDNYLAKSTLIIKKYQNYNKCILDNIRKISGALGIKDKGVGRTELLADERKKFVKNKKIKWKKTINIKTKRITRYQNKQKRL